LSASSRPIARRFADARGQSVVEFGLLLPLICVLVLGTIELGYALLDHHVVTKLSREGSNLISRDATLQDAVTAIRNMSTRPVDFSSNSTVIFSVIKKIDTAGAANYDVPVLYQRTQYGALSATSSLTTAGSGSFGGPPYYTAVNADNDSNLRITNMPGNLTMVTGETIYVTEIYTQHTLLTPLDRFGITVPQTFYSIAYF
jgi:Flp pilus assembly protein TadG